MAQQRSRRRSATPRKAPDWVPDELLQRIGALVHDDDFARDARKVPLLWGERLELLLGHAGGPLPADEAIEPLDELAERYGIARVALAMLHASESVTRTRPAVMRFLAENGLAPMPELPPAPEREAGSEAEEEGDRQLRDRERHAEELRRERERVRDKDRKLREERAAHAATRSELTSDRDKARHRALELERQLAEGPTGAVLDDLRQARDDAERASTAERERTEAAEAALAAAKADHARLRAAVAAAETDAVNARDEADRARRDVAAARDAAPTHAELLRAARHVGAVALLRLGAPAPGDAELLEAVAGIARWSVAVSPPASPPAPAPPAAEPAPAAVPAAPRARSRSARRPPPSEPSPARITVLGGGGVGSSSYLVEHAGCRVLLDCGIAGGSRQAEIPAGLDALVLSHAHGDHMAGVPELLRRHPDLRVYCSKPTKLLATYQANAAEGYIPGDRILVRDPGETYRILDGAVELTLHRVAHCLGSCAIRLRFADGLVVVYSGDLGGSGLRTLRPSDQLPLGGAHAVLLEATLGDRGPSRANYEETLVREVAAVLEDGGCAVFPAANIGRAQELAALLGDAFAAGSLPEAPVHMTPLARRVLDRYRAGDRDGWLADARYPTVRTLSPETDADELVGAPGYAIVGGASALERRSAEIAFAAAKRRECGVFFTGYSGPNARQKTRGDSFELVGDDGRAVATTIASRWQWTPSPDHADRQELVAAVSHLDRRVPVLLVHGVDVAKRALGERLRSAGHADVRALVDGDAVQVVPPAV